MGLGRRDFLKLMGATIAAIAARPMLRAVALVDDVYFNRKLGVSFKKPAGWYFNNVSDMGEVAKGQILDLEDKQLATKIVSSVDLPIVSISKVPLSTSDPDFTPGINVYMNFRPWGKASQKKSELLLSIQNDIRSNRRLLKKFRVISSEAFFRVSSCLAAQYISSFWFEHEAMIVPVRVRMKALLVIQGDVWYTFRMYDAPSRGKNFTFDFSPFINSILIV